MDNTYDEEPKPAKKRFSLTIIGEADYIPGLESGDTTFKQFYLENKQKIEDALNNVNSDSKEPRTFTVNSYLRNFRLSDDIGQVQEN